MPKAATQAAIEAELSARDNAKAQQQALSSARQALIEAERAVGELAAKRSALEEAASRLSEDIEEASARIVDTDASLLAMVDTAKSEAQLETLRMRVAEDRAKLAEARAASQGLLKEAEARAPQARGNQAGTRQLAKPDGQRKSADFNTVQSS